MTIDIRQIAPGKGEVTIGNSEIEIRGLSMQAFAGVISRFPAFLGFLGTGAVEDPVQLLMTLPLAALDVMTEGIGKGGDAEIMEILSGWELSQQVTLFNAVINRTLQGPAVPFVQTLLAAAAGAAARSRVSPENLPDPETSAPSSPSSPTS